jgi:UDP-glucuronate 4-epimerase
MKILITGTAGFIGFHSAIKYLNAGYEVIGLDNINDYYDINLKYNRLMETGINQSEITYNKLISSNKFQKYKFIKLNIEDEESLNYLFKNEQFDLVINLAAQAGVRYSITNPDSYIKSNIIGFHNILECCRRFNVKKLLYASSSSVYGLSEKEILSINDRTDNPISLYAATKKSNELFAHVYSHLYGIQTIGMRFFTVYGPWGRPDMAPILFTNSIISQEIIKIFNHGEMQRDFTYIEDIVEGIFLISKSNITNNYTLLNIGNSKPIKLLDFVKCLETELKIDAKKEFLNLQPGDVIKTFANIDELVKLTGFKPKTSINIGVEKFIKWFLFYYK